MKRMSNKFHRRALTIIIFGDLCKHSIKKPTFSSCTTCPSLPSFTTKEREQFQCLEIVLNNKKNITNSVTSRDIAPLTSGGTAQMPSPSLHPKYKVEPVYAQFFLLFHIVWGSGGGTARHLFKDSTAF